MRRIYSILHPREHFQSCYFRKEIKAIIGEYSEIKIININIKTCSVYYYYNFFVNDNASYNSSYKFVLLSLYSLTKVHLG